MKHSRVVKFKEYRDSFTKANAQDIAGANDIISGLAKENVNTSTTNTLPYEQVIHEVDLREEQEKLLKKEKYLRIAKIIGFSLIGLAVISLFIVLGILAFGGVK